MQLYIALIEAYIYCLWQFSLSCMSWMQHGHVHRVARARATLVATQFSVEVALLNWHCRASGFDRDLIKPWVSLAVAMVN